MCRSLLVTFTCIWSLLVTFFVEFFEYIFYQPNPQEINLFDSHQEYTTANDSIISARDTHKRMTKRVFGLEVFLFSVGAEFKSRSNTNMRFCDVLVVQTSERRTGRSGFHDVCTIGHSQEAVLLYERDLYRLAARKCINSLHSRRRLCGEGGRSGGLQG